MNNPNYQYAMPYPNQNFQPNQPNLDSPIYPNQNPLQPGQISDFEESYIENILRLNKGKVGTFYMTYNDSLEYRDKVYRGIIQAAGKDHLVISDTRDGKRYILLLVYLDYVEFDEPINYEYPIN
jgi:spore germination protein Q